jgi:hypothetical protein
VRSQQDDPRAFDVAMCVDDGTNMLAAGDQQSGHGHDLDNLEGYLNRVRR